MPSAENFEWPQGEPLFEVMWRTVTESLAGNGIVSNGDFQCTPGTNNREIDVAAGTYFYVGSNYSLGSTTTVGPVSTGGTDDRWDLVYFDTATSSPGVREGTAGANPEPPDVSGDEVPLAFVYVPANFDDVFSSSQILNWRGKFSNEAEEVHYDDSTGDYGVSNVDAALDAIDLDFVRGRDNTIAGVLGNLGTNPGAFSSIIDATIDSNSASGTQHSYSFSLDATDLIQFYAESDGAGGIQNAEVRFPVATSLVNGDIVTSELASGAVTSAKVADGTLVDADISSSTTIARGKLDDERIVTGPVTTNTTTSGEEVILVDTSGGAVTITLASADVSQGNFVTIVDVGGAAGTNAITIDTESTETIDGASSTNIDTDHGSLVVLSDDTNWFTGAKAGGGIALEDDQTVVADPATAVSAGPALQASDDGDNSGTLDVDYDQLFTSEAGEAGLASGNQLLIGRTELADGEALEIYQCSLTVEAAQAAPTDLDLIIATFPGDGTYTQQTKLIDGDGATVHAEVTGNPVGSYTNTSGGTEVVGILAENATGGSQDVHGSADGVVV